jgi:L-seryl-tRNA selenium transferase
MPLTALTSADFRYQLPRKPFECGSGLRRWPTAWTGARERAARLTHGTLRRVINATGVILHTNLGRAPLAPEVVEAVASTGAVYSNPPARTIGGGTVLDPTPRRHGPRSKVRVGVSDPSSQEFRDRVARLATEAFTEYADWATLRRRHASTSEIHRGRVLALFADTREEPEAVEKLVDELAFPETRARTLVARLKFSDAKRLRKLALKQGLDDLRTRLGATSAEDERKFVRLPG